MFLMQICLVSWEKLCDLLITPVQRIMKYELMLRDILKYSERAGLIQEVPYLQDAIYIMRVRPSSFVFRFLQT